MEYNEKNNLSQISIKTCFYLPVNTPGNVILNLNLRNLFFMGMKSHTLKKNLFSPFLYNNYHTTQKPTVETLPDKEVFPNP